MKDILKIILIVYSLTGCGKAGPPIAKDTIIPPSPSIKRAIYRDGSLLLITKVETQTTSLLKVENLCTGEQHTVSVQGSLSFFKINVDRGCNVKVSALNRYGKGKSITIYISDVIPPNAEPFHISVIKDKVELNFTKKFPKNIYRFPDYTEVPLNEAPISTPLFVDHSVKRGNKYRYIVRNVIISNGVEMEGKASISSLLTATDRTPPPTPSHVIPVPVGNRIKIEWSPCIAEDLEGYFIYVKRKGKVLRLTPQPLKETSYFLKEKAEWVGISSVDTSGNESKIKWERIK